MGGPAPRGPSPLYFLAVSALEALDPLLDPAGDLGEEGLPLPLDLPLHGAALALGAAFPSLGLAAWAVGLGRFSSLKYQQSEAQ